MLLMLVTSILAGNAAAYPASNTSASYCPALTADTSYTDYRIAWTYNSPLNTLLPDHIGGGWSNNQFDQSVISSAPAQVIGPGMNYTFDADKQTVLHLSGVDQVDATTAFNTGDYIEYQFSTNNTMNLAQLFNGLAFATHNYTQSYKIAILLSEDNFLTATTLLNDFTISPASGWYQWVDAYTAQAIYLKPNTQYKFRVLFYSATNTNAVYWDDFHVSMGVCQDYSDAPQNNYGAASHDIPRIASHYMGSSAPDAERSVQDGGDNGAGADGDDTNGTAPDDEDAAIFPTLQQGGNGVIITTVNGSGGYLQGWIDWNGDGDFNDFVDGVSERISVDAQDNITAIPGRTDDSDGITGQISMAVTVPASANPGQSYARFRWSTTAGLDSSTPASDGEVEDYQVTIQGVARIAGTVYRDDDNSNTKNVTEPGIANITVTLFNDNGTPTDISDDTQINSATTTGSGSYLFDNLSVGTFRVSVDTNDTDLPTGASIGTSNPVYNITTSLGSTQYANFGFDIFTCVPGGGSSDSAITPYISTEVDGTGVNARNATDTLDDDWRSAAGLPQSGAAIPWFGFNSTNLNNNEPTLFTTRGINVGVALVNIEPTAPCEGNVHSSGGPKLSTSNTMQQSSARPSSLYDSSGQPAFWNESSGSNSSPNAIRFSFAQPVKSFGAWFGDLETRTDGFGTPAYLRLLDGSGNRIGMDIAIEPQTISNGSTTSTVDQNQCGSTASNTGCGNTTTRWVGFVDNALNPRIHQAIVIVGDDDFADLAGSESISFIGMDINTGYNLSGRVYQDSNVDGVDNAEAGIGAVTIVLHDSAANSCQSTQTNADGYYAFHDVQIAAADNYVIYEAAQAANTNPASCPPLPSDPNGFISSTSNTHTVSVTNADIAGLNFGDVAIPHFSQDNQQTILPNSSVSHPHIFTANSDGIVNFNLSINSDPGNLYWGQTLYQDVNCDAQLDDNDQPVSGGLLLNAGEQICLLVKVIAPANATNGAVHTVYIQSDFSYGDGNTGLANQQQTHTDITTVNNDDAPTPASGTGKLSLFKSVWNVSRNIDGSVALPGETLRYTIFYENIGSGPLNELVINDAVPEFTEWMAGSMNCTDRPAGLAACSVFNNAGSLSWEWTTTDKLQPGASGSVSYEVRVE